MATYAQLQSESWWGREIQTPELAWFGDQLCAALGVGRDHFGTKGDNAHLNGGHRSQEWLKNSRYCTNRTYTTVTGLSAEQARHIAAFDITPKTRDQMLAISRNLDKVTRAGQLEEVVEWYGNTNNDQRVDGWNNIKNAVASSDSSHLWHLHGTFDRRVLRDRSVMQRTLNALLSGTGSAATVPATTLGADMPLLFLVRLAGNATVRLCRDFMDNRVITSEKSLATTQGALKSNGLGTTVWEWPDTPEHRELLGVNIDSIDDPDTAAVALTDAQINALGLQIRQGVPSLDQIRGVVDDELDEQSRGGADNDA